MTQFKGCLYVWDTHTLFAGGPGLSNKHHGHYAASLILAPDTPLDLHIKNGPHTKGRAFLLRPNLVHRLDAAKTRLLAVHLDPDSPEYQSLAPLLADKTHAHLPLPDIQDLDAFINGDADDIAAANLFSHIITTISGVTPPPVQLDPRIPQVLAAIRETLPESISVNNLADEVDLSPDRLMHLFKAQLGLTIRRYVLWARLRAALHALKSGGNLTRAAHDAGFSDSAHLSRTFREMFGMKPSTILGDSRFVQVRFCNR